MIEHPGRRDPRSFLHIDIAEHEQRTLATQLELRTNHSLHGLRANRLPVAVEPVGAMPSTPGCATSGAPHSAP